MNSEGIGQPHDRLVRQVFSRKETAARFLEAYLPPTLAASLEWSRLELHPGSYVDARLRHQESDLLFCVPFRGVGKTEKSPQNLLLYCLFEHQRNVEPWMILRLLVHVANLARIDSKQSEDEALATYPASGALPGAKTVEYCSAF
jgi:predicted transposase/invertase (TIGR01784 family)